MPVLIDGNNLLYAAQEQGDPERPVSRSRLCQTLGEWARRTDERVHVIFDGPAPGKDLAEQIGDPDIQVSFSGAGISADERLFERLEEDSAARRLLVVSSDREIVRAAKRRRARSIASGLFWAAVRDDLSRSPPPKLEPPEKTRGLDPRETEQWLRELGFGEEDASEAERAND